MADMYKNNTTNNDERIAAVAGHEGFHGSDKENMMQLLENLKGGNNDIEKGPIQVEMEILNQTGWKKMPFLQPIMPTQIPITQPLNTQNK